MYMAISCTASNIGSLRFGSGGGVGGRGGKGALDSLFGWFEEEEEEGEEEERFLFVLKPMIHLKRRSNITLRIQHEHPSGSNLRNQKP